MTKNMIDCHCHLEQEDYDSDRQDVIKKCREKLKALVTCCAKPKDWSLTKEIVLKNKGFVYAIAGIHPEFIKEISEKEINDFISAIKTELKKRLVKGIGEIGLDYHWIKEEEWREKQRKLFIKMINLAKELNLPLIIHSRDAVGECIEILEKSGMKGKKVLMHLMTEREFLQRITENGWMISIGPGILRSKAARKTARDCPVSNLMLETDSPWFGQGERGTPLNVIKAAEKIAEIKKISVEEVEKKTDENAINFFNLK